MKVSFVILFALVLMLALATYIEGKPQKSNAEKIWENLVSKNKCKKTYRTLQNSHAAFYLAVII